MSGYCAPGYCIGISPTPEEASDVKALLDITVKFANLARYVKSVPGVVVYILYPLKNA